MDDLIAPPGIPISPGDAAAQALFVEARRRRRHRRLAGIAAVLVAAAVVAVSTVTWLPRVLGQGTGSGGTAGANLAARSTTATGRARITYRVVTAGVLAAYGTDDVTFSGNNRSSSVSGTTLAIGPEPATTQSGTERIVDGQVYDYSRYLGRLTWVHVPNPSYVNVKIIDPRRLLRMLESVSRFQAAGYQMIGGDRLKVLRATDPGRLTRRALLPVVYTSGQPVTSLEIWADQQGVVHRMAFTFRAPGARIMLRKPVSKAAARTYLRAQRAEDRTMKKAQHLARTGKRRLSESRINLAMRRLDQAMLRAYAVRRGAQVTATTVTFSAVGQPQHITVPPHATSLH